MRIRKILIGIILAFSFAIFINNTSASASQWHKGTPKFMRGTFQDFNKKKKYQPHEIATSSSKVVMWDSVNPYFLSINTRYKHLGNGKYRLEGIPGAQSFYGGKSIFTVTKHGNNHFMLKQNYMLLHLNDGTNEKHKSSKKELSWGDGYYSRIHNNDLAKVAGLS